MRILLFLLPLFIISNSVVGQVNCNHKHSKPMSNNKALNSRSDTVDVLNYTINLDMTDYAGHFIKGNCEIEFVSKLNGVNVIGLDLLEMNIDSIKSQGNLLTYNYNDTLLEVTLPITLNALDTSSLVVYYNGIPQQDASGWGGFYYQSGYAFNLGVGFAANPHNYGRVWFPCFDNFVERTTYEFNIITAQGMKAHCNGELISETVINADTISRNWVLNEEIPTYLACVAVANYETVNMNHAGINGNIPIELVAKSADTNNLKNSFIHLTDAIDIYEDNYGPYLWNKVGFSLVPFGSGAMEHATNIAYPLSAANGSLGSETLMAHEFAHHWWGNLVTCETAEDMWINEGMASYSEHLFLENVYDHETYIDEVINNHAAILQFAHVNEGGYLPISGVPHQYTYGDHTYKKGASVAHNMRAYMGDSLFFYGLKSITNNYQFQHINASQFRDELTNATGVDMSNFFNDWVFAPGYSHFSLDSSEVVQNGANFDITLFVQQKLKGAVNYHTNTPLEVTFFDANWNKHKVEILASGQYSNTIVTIPFMPVLTIVNNNNRLNQARTEDQLVVDVTGTKTLNLSKFVLTTNSIVDSALIQVEHHWVAPDSIKNNPYNYRLSNSRYWSVKGILPSTYSSSAKLVYDGKASAGYLDADLVSQTEDSLILLYREDAKSDWTEYPYYTKNMLGTTPAYGWINISNLQMGEYTFANGITPTAIKKGVETSNNITIYPNPTDSFFWVKGHKYTNTAKLKIFDLTGKLVYSNDFNKKQKVSTSLWKSGTYIVSVFEENKQVYSDVVLVK